jgi:hypothetical protein
MVSNRPLVTAMTMSAGVMPASRQMMYPAISNTKTANPFRSAQSGGELDRVFCGVLFVVDLGVTLRHIASHTMP